MTREIIFILLFLGFLIAFFKIEIYFIHKSRESFRTLAEAKRELEQSRTNLYNLLKDKELHK